MNPNPEIFEAGFDAALLHEASPDDNPYGTMACDPDLDFQRWSWLMGFCEGLRDRIEKREAS